MLWIDGMYKRETTLNVGLVCDLIIANVFVCPQEPNHGSDPSSMETRYELENLLAYKRGLSLKQFLIQYV